MKKILKNIFKIAIVVILLVYFPKLSAILIIVSIFYWLACII